MEKQVKKDDEVMRSFQEAAPASAVFVVDLGKRNIGQERCHNSIKGFCKEETGF